MVGFLIKRFAKGDVKNPEVRRRYGVICALCGIAVNIILFAFKLAVALATNAVSVMADAFNNLGDVASSAVTLIGFKLAAQAPDEGHPYGHGRIEYVAGTVVSGFIFVMGLSLFKSGAEKIFHPRETQASLVSVAVLSAAALAKLYMYCYNKRYAKIIESAAMEAVATDSISDCLATCAVLLCALINMLTGVDSDGIVASAVAVFIIISGIKAFKETIDPLLGRAPEKAFTQSIEAIVLSNPKVTGIHDLVVHDYGPGRVMVSLHAEVDSKGSIVELHEAIDEIEREVSEKMHCETVIHMDPVTDNDEHSAQMKNKICILLRQNVCADMTIHDFRVTAGNNPTILFDCAISPRLSGESEKIKKAAEKAVEDNFPEYKCIVKIDIQI